LPTLNPTSQGCGVANAQHPISNAEVSRAALKSKTALLFPLDETDVTAAFDIAVADVLDIFSSCLQPQILFKVMFGNMIASHRAQNEIAIFDNDFRRAFDQHSDQS